MPYASRPDVEDIYGGDNVAKWADLNNTRDDAQIAGRIGVALQKADVEVNDRLRGGPYSVPFADPVPEGIINLAAVYAGYWLYSSRAVDDEEDGKDIFSRKIKEFDQKIRDILYGRYKPMQTEQVTYPQVVPIADMPRAWPSHGACH